MESRIALKTKGKARISRRILRAILWLITALLVLFGLQLTALAFPQPFFSHRAQAGAVTIYSGDSRKSELDALASEADRRLQASSLYDSTRSDRVFVFDNEGLFRTYARVSFLRPDLQGFCLSIFNNSYINVPRIQRLAGYANPIPKFSIAEGSLVHVIVHEIAHTYLFDHIGRSTWKALPLWKREGYCEYVANKAIIDQDSSSSIRHRLDILNDDSIWGPGYSHARVHYEAELLWGFLLDIECYSIEDIVADSVLRDDVLADLAIFCTGRDSSRADAIK